MNFHRSCSLCVLSLAAWLTGCASTRPDPAPASQTAPAATQASAPKPAAGQWRVPMLRVKTDCGSCEVSETVRGYITDAYARMAAEEGAQMSSTDVATLTIKSYTARSGFARLTAGALAGKDEIKATIEHQGKSHEVEDYYRNAWQGIGQVAENIGELAYSKLKQPK
ncbi:MAG: hypothetical protein GTN84_06025 [Hydrogenophaga sp.]|uniref:hypothetical protein n=1 Tax=Hydrogenophaga sp. TaxID=1904254 RepID=UPI0016ACD8FD|nr:hypothetical protein [Hydrogenophaga sp.]NIM40550.1 hypothetical protein [Hydrogenophaga sp.]NIN25968.1 hypothetical protein [Hydrogenophaga sp.]NIN30840.1 hypothetical protein [Hydrogenophaga sp.]NIN54933.1 hypothetical protein [Hydrogenophaga sp.]NIO50973.1 hypothetical protein [Hydrogenophaga sp.]